MPQAARSRGPFGWRRSVLAQPRSWMLLYPSLANPRHDRTIQSSGCEWLLSTLFDASLLTPEPPHGGSFLRPSGFLRARALPQTWVCMGASGWGGGSLMAEKHGGSGGYRWGAALRCARGCAWGTQDASAVTILAQWQGDLLTLACEAGGL